MIAPHKKSPFADLLILSACLGLVTGLIEGGGLLLFHGGPWVNSGIPEGVSAEIVWVSAVFNLTLFVMIGFALGYLGARWKRIPSLRTALFVFSLMAVADWVGVTGRVSVLGTVSLSLGAAVSLARVSLNRQNRLVEICRRCVPPLVAGTVLVFVAIQVYPWLRERTALAALPRQSGPNVLVIVVDTLRADHLSVYGYARPTSPHLQQITREGVLFENAIAPSSWTLPSHASLLTGRYPHEHGADWQQPLSTRYPTLPEILQSAGYRTGAFSANTDYFSRRAGVARGFLLFDDYFYSVADAVYRTFWGRTLFRRYFADLFHCGELPARRSAENVNRSALRWIDQERSRPFFVFLNYFDVHEPYLPYKQYRNLFGDASRDVTCIPTWRHSIDPFSDRSDVARLTGMSKWCFQRAVDHYDDNIRYVDDQIAALFAGLRERNLEKNTIVVITSDHGESFREHGLVTHGGALYRELIHVPLIYWWPGHIPSNITITEPVSTASLPATITELTSVPDQNAFSLSSVSILWRQPQQQVAWQAPLSEVSQNRLFPSIFPAAHGWLKSLVDADWHLIVPQSSPPQLYSWKADVHESRDLTNSSEGRQVMHETGTNLWNMINHSNVSSLHSLSSVPINN